MKWIFFWAGCFFYKTFFITRHWHAEFFHACINVTNYNDFSLLHEYKAKLLLEVLKWSFLLLDCKSNWSFRFSRIYLKGLFFCWRMFYRNKVLRNIFCYNYCNFSTICVLVYSIRYAKIFSIKLSSKSSHLFFVSETIKVSLLPIRMSKLFVKELMMIWANVTFQWYACEVYSNLLWMSNYFYIHLWSSYLDYVKFSVNK